MNRDATTHQKSIIELLITGNAINQNILILEAMQKNRTELSKPSVSNIMKKMSAQNIEPGMVAMAAGQTMKTKPGPSVATSLMDFPLAWAM